MTQSKWIGVRVAMVCAAFGLLSGCASDEDGVTDENASTSADALRGEKDQQTKGDRGDEGSRNVEKPGRGDRDHGDRDAEKPDHGDRDHGDRDHGDRDHGDRDHGDRGHGDHGDRDHDDGVGGLANVAGGTSVSSSGGNAPTAAGGSSGTYDPPPAGTGGALSSGGASWGTAGSWGSGGGIALEPGVCGDGVYDYYGTETCDDGNLLAGDGCSPTCTLEANWVCNPGEACHVIECGDGLQESSVDENGQWYSESCEDGNIVGGDGCSSTCTPEAGYDCMNVGAPCILAVCGDGSQDYYWDAAAQSYTQEACDDGNQASGDGCNEDCRYEAGWYCPSNGEPCVQAICGNGTIDSKYVVDEHGYEYATSESCDDGNTESGDGCGADCEVEMGWTCWTGTECIQAICGDGQVEQYYAGPAFGYVQEGCDDGNVTSGDGCGDSCETEAGWICRAQGEPCRQPACGDGYTDWGYADGLGNWVYLDESCDDGNATSGDGCSELCSTEPGWVCRAEGEPCYQPTCGDGYQDWMYTDTSGNSVYLDEYCDDGNLTNGDGCSSTCQPEAGYACPAEGQPCHRITCGDGLTESGADISEGCDDGNLTSGDGCSAGCTVEAGFSCDSSSPSICQSGACGDGIIQCYAVDSAGNYFCESCDDGNRINDDLCDNNCNSSGDYTGVGGAGAGGWTGGLVSAGGARMVSMGAGGSNN
jgi:large repetitive protein